MTFWAEMRAKIRIILPLVQVALAVVLNTSNYLRPDTITSPSCNKFEIQFCHGLNAPVAVITNYLTEVVYCLVPRPYPIELLIRRGLYFVLVWLLCYAVSVEIGGEGRSVLTAKTKARRPSDALAVIFGGVLGTVGLMLYRTPTGTGIYWKLMAIPYFIWAITITIFYGRDLWASLRNARRI